MRNRLSIGVIGAGRIGRLHVENIASHIKEAEVKIVADICLDNLDNLSDVYGISNITNDYKEVINMSEVDAVLICSCTDTHADMIIEAARAGKHIFCEKPMALNIERAREALQAVKVSGVKLQIGFNRRFDHNHRSVRSAVLSGIIGEPHLICISSKDPTPPPLEYCMVSGGLFMDMTIHDFDMARYLSGSEVVEVFAAGSVLVDKKIGEIGDIDTAVVTLKFESGALGVISNSRKSDFGYDQRVEVFGSLGCVADYNDLPSTTVISTAAGIYSDKPYSFFIERYDNSFVAEMKAFVEAIIYDKEPEVSGDDGLKPILIALAASKSYRINRPVKVCEIE